MWNNMANWACPSWSAWCSDSDSLRRVDRARDSSTYWKIVLKSVISIPPFVRSKWQAETTGKQLYTMELRGSHIVKVALLKRVTTSYAPIVEKSANRELVYANTHVHINKQSKHLTLPRLQKEERDHILLLGLEKGLHERLLWSKVASKKSIAFFCSPLIVILKLATWNNSHSPLFMMSMLIVVSFNTRQLLIVDCFLSIIL